MYVLNIMQESYDECIGCVYICVHLDSSANYEMQTLAHWRVRIIDWISS